MKLKSVNLGNEMYCMVDAEVRPAGMLDRYAPSITLTQDQVDQLPQWFFDKYVHRGGWAKHDKDGNLIEDHFYWYANRDYQAMFDQVHSMILNGYQAEYIMEVEDVPLKFVQHVALKTISYSFASKELSLKPFAKNSYIFNFVIRYHERKAEQKLLSIIMA